MSESRNEYRTLTEKQERALQKYLRQMYMQSKERLKEPISRLDLLDKRPQDLTDEDKNALRESIKGIIDKTIRTGIRRRHTESIVNQLSKGRFAELDEVPDAQNALYIALYQFPPDIEAELLDQPAQCKIELEHRLADLKAGKN